MSQATLDEDELFGEAASEVREDVEASLEEARTALPAADDVWNVEADNTLGALNALRSALDTGDAEDALRDAKKWYTMGERADAFEDAEDLEAEIERVGDAVEDVEDAREQVGDLTSTVPDLKNSLEDLHSESEAAGGTDGASGSEDADETEDAEADPDDAEETDAEGGDAAESDAEGAEAAE